MRHAAPSERERVEALKALGLPRGARPDEIRATYLRLARELHPDVNPAGDGEFRRIAAAYELLRRHHRRPAAESTGPTRDGRGFDPDWWRAFGDRV
ncbi:MAG TPA: J domain-containing protein [Chloroflexota bacterium]|nr:J domain-containing protein [Chloroflexota bacterium]